ncbi:immunity 52 family protein [Corallococcus interemptor]|uniref:immunity 52 family protein n=1 Tax=Corallococcus interemptor TaxID=2316720 RepID=UPI003CFCA2C1
MAEQPEAEEYYVGAYWGPRKESPEDCARRTAELLTLLSACDPLLAHWYKPARSRKDARKQPLIPSDLATLTEAFRRGANREKGGPAIEQLGFTFWFGNGGARGEDVDLRITCGDYGGATPNSCVMTLPSIGANTEQLITAPVLTSVVRSMALAWEPDWATATSWEHRAAMAETPIAGGFVGWVTYLPRRRGSVPPLPAPLRIEPVENRGALIVLTPERLTASNPEHVERGKRVGELLARSGVLEPVIAR